MLSIVIVEDLPNIRNGLAVLLNGTPDLECVGVYETCEDMLQKLDSDDPELILMDIGLPGMSGLEGIEQVRQRRPEQLIVVLSIYEDNENVFAALCAGACGYLVKNTPPAQLVAAIHEAHQGGSPMSSHIARKVVGAFQHGTPPSSGEASNLSTREKEVLAAMARGDSYKMVADTLHISIETVRFHIRNLYKKLQVHSQSAAVAKAIRKGWI